MAYNVISYKENEQKKHQKNVDLAPELRNHQKWPKIFALNRDLLNFLYSYVIF